MKKKNRRLLTAVITAAFTIAVVVLIGAGVKGFDQNLSQQQLDTVQASVRNAAVHCYALEGSYPPSLDYLAKNYGLVLDRSRYIYDYRIFATNIPPEIHVLKK